MTHLEWSCPRCGWRFSAKLARGGLVPYHGVNGSTRGAVCPGSKQAPQMPPPEPTPEKPADESLCAYCCGTGIHTDDPTGQADCGYCGGSGKRRQDSRETAGVSEPVEATPPQADGLPEPKPDKPLPKTFAKRLAFLRKRIGLTPGELGEKIGCHEQTIRKLELGTHCWPLLNTASKLAKVLGVSLETLAGDTE